MNLVDAIDQAQRLSQDYETTAYVRRDGEEYRVTRFNGEDIIYQTDRRYRQGERIRICAHPPQNETQAPAWNASMSAHCGETHTVDSLSYGAYPVTIINGRSWAWNPCWIAPAELYESAPVQAPAVATDSALSETVARIPSKDRLPSIAMCSVADCGEAATGYDGKCFHHTSCSHELKEYSARPNPGNRVRDPIGVELECFDPSPVRGRLRVPHLARFVCSDGSLPDGGGEIKLCGSLSKAADMAADVAQRGAIAGCQVNRQCGLHVHLSLPKDICFIGGAVYRNGTRIGYDGVNRIAKTAIAIQSSLFDMMPPSRRSNTYCKQVRSADTMSDHYSWLSMSSRVPTLEVRIHGGSLNPWKVKAWVEVCTYLRQRFHADLIADQPEVQSVFDLVPKGTLAHRYLSARAKSPVLERFGF